MNEHDIRNTLVNPFYAITIDPYLFLAHQAWLTKREWIVFNTVALEDAASESESGIRLWLRDFLSLMHSAAPEERQRSLRTLKSFPSNPCLAIALNPDLSGPHKPLVPRTQWIAANAQLIDEIGAEAWLKTLLATLEGDDQ